MFIIARAKRVKDSDYDFFPLSYYYGDGVNPKDFKPFEYMEEEVLTKYLKLENPFEKQRIIERINPYKELTNNLFEDFSYDELGGFLSWDYGGKTGFTI